MGLRRLYLRGVDGVDEVSGDADDVAIGTEVLDLADRGQDRCRSEVDGTLVVGGGSVDWLQWPGGEQIDHRGGATGIE